MIMVMSTHPADNLDDHRDENDNGDNDKWSVYDNSMAFADMKIWTKNPKANLKNNNHPREIGCWAPILPSRPLYRIVQNFETSLFSPQHMSRQRRLWAQQGSPAKWDKWEGARGGVHCPAVKWDHPQFMSCNSFHKLNRERKQTFSSGEISHQEGCDCWFFGLVQVRIIQFGGLPFWLILYKGLKEISKLLKILHIFVWVLSDEIVFWDFTTFWCFCYLL